jgi:hypothetical protein
MSVSRSAFGDRVRPFASNYEEKTVNRISDAIGVTHLRRWCGAALETTRTAGT